MASPSPQPVKETHTMMKDYDPTTGNKMINKYMVVRELGRGVHGKVKLCRDTVTDELCVSPMHRKEKGVDVAKTHTKRSIKRRRREEGGAFWTLPVMAERMNRGGTCEGKTALQGKQDVD
jgi:serine/threonine protein kinase